MSIKNAVKTLKDAGYNNIIEGGAKGADALAREEAEIIGIKVVEFPAQWDKFGKAAGMIRNIKMLIDGKPIVVIYFHNELSKSKGTKHMVQEAKRAGIRVVNGMLLQ